MQTPTNAKQAVAIKWFLVAFITTTILSCNNNSTNNPKNTEERLVSDTNKVNEPVKPNLRLDTTFNCEGTANLLVSESEGMKMIDLFGEHYRKEKHPPIKDNLEKRVWIDSCVITAVADFFETNLDLDGIRIYGGAYSSKKSTVMFMPTRRRAGNPPPANEHENVNRRIPTAAGCNRSEFKNFNLSPTIFGQMETKFGEHREETSPGSHTTAKLDSLSVSVWVGRCVFKALSELIRANSTTLDGVNIHFAAYDTMDSTKHPGQKYQYQSTIILVPTDKGKKDNWKIIKSSSIYLKYGFYDGYNHGSLCPNYCPTD